MAAANCHREVFWTREDNEESESSLVEVPGVSIPGNRRPKPKVKCRKTREIRAAVPITQPVVQNLTPKKVMDDSSPKHSHKSSPNASIPENYSKDSDKPSRRGGGHHQRKASLKDLCAEDKKRVANLIRELARLGQEKDVTEQKLDGERTHFEQQMSTLLDQQDTLLRDRSLVQKQLLECQQLLVQYQHQVLELSEKAPSSGNSTPRKDNPAGNPRTVSSKNPPPPPAPAPIHDTINPSTPAQIAHGNTSNSVSRISGLPPAPQESYQSSQFAPANYNNNNTQQSHPYAQVGFPYGQNLGGWSGPQYAPWRTLPPEPRNISMTTTGSVYTDKQYYPDPWGPRYHVPSAMPSHRPFTQLIDDQIAQERNIYSTAHPGAHHETYSTTHSAYNNVTSEAYSMPSNMPDVYDHYYRNGYTRSQHFRNHGHHSNGSTQSQSQDSAALPEPLLSSTICNDPPHVYNEASQASEQPFVLRPQRAEEFRPLVRDFSPRSSVNSVTSAEAPYADHKQSFANNPERVSDRVFGNDHILASPILHAHPVDPSSKSRNNSKQATDRKTEGDIVTRYSDLPADERKQQLVQQKKLLLAEQERLRKVLAEQESMLRAKQQQLQNQQLKQQKRLQYFEKNGQFPSKKDTSVESRPHHTSVHNKSRDTDVQRGDEKRGLTDSMDRQAHQFDKGYNTGVMNEKMSPALLSHRSHGSHGNYSDDYLSGRGSQHTPTSNHLASVMDTVESIEHCQPHVSFYGNQIDAANQSGLSGGILPLDGSVLSVQEEGEDELAEESRVLEEVFFIR